MNKETKAVKLGQLGENIVEKLLRSKGHEVETSISGFDDKKDMTVNGKGCEVKTQQLFMIKKAFTAPHSQMKKCMEVEHLVFVETPSPYNDQASVYYSQRADRQNLEVYTQRSGKKVLIFPKKDMKYMNTVTDQNINSEMIRLSSTDYNWTKPKRKY